MSTASRINLGIVGACGRGGSFRVACQAIDAVRLYAVCDTNVDRLEKARVDLGADVAYTDYAAMLADPHIDAVIVGTPMPLHAPQSIAALRAGKHVLSEVTAAVSIAECRDLVAAATGSGKVYMMAENYTYSRSNILVRALVQSGLFGRVYYAEGEYLHELKALNEATPGVGAGRPAWTGSRTAPTVSARSFNGSARATGLSASPAPGAGGSTSIRAAISTRIRRPA